jgi:protein TonB
MFDKLVLSTKERRKARSSKFFAATSLLYLLAIASAVVFSVVSANPGIFEASEIVHLTASPPPPVAPAQPVVTRRSQANTPQPNIYKVKDLEQIIRQPVATPPVISPGVIDPEVGNRNGIQGDVRLGVPDGLLKPEAHDPPPPTPIQPRVELPPQQPAPEKQIVKLPSSVLTGKAIVKKSPDYPPMAKQIRLAGSVTVEIMISPDGRVESARALNGHPLLMQASVAAAREWRFQPTMLNGVPVRVTGVITFNFTLN